jgi:hypothetical protein
MKFAHVLAVAAIASTCLACSVDERKISDEPVLTSVGGSLTVDWTIRGAANSSECVAVDATSIEITVRDGADRAIGTFQQSCSAFETSIALAGGIYSAEARLIGPAGARTTNVRIDYFTLYDKSQLTEPIDFPTTAVLVGASSH